jgi:hypothetical protein
VGCFGLPRNPSESSREGWCRVVSCRATSGSSVSTALARAVTGLPDSVIQRLFHQLKREGEAAEAPSEKALKEWRERQEFMLRRMTGMSERRMNSLEQKLFRSRSEPIPDAASFYAWSRIEGLARQEAVIEHAGHGVIDLEPPGSQADVYDLDEEGRPTFVWYASYGSNMHEDRFMAYVQGGRPEGATRTYAGCTDKTPPVEDVPIRFHARPHFAMRSTVWSGGVAFVDPDPQAACLGRAYLITAEQFDEVVAQENGTPVSMADQIDFEQVLLSGTHRIGDGQYETMVHIGDYEGAPVITFTAPFSARDAIAGDQVLPTRSWSSSSVSGYQWSGSSQGSSVRTRELDQAAESLAESSNEPALEFPVDDAVDVPESPAALFPAEPKVLASYGGSKKKGKKGKKGKGGGTASGTTASSSTPTGRKITSTKPSEAYVRMIGSGLAETFDMDEVAQADYIRGCPGGDQWKRNDLVRVLRGETLQRETPRSEGFNWADSPLAHGQSYESARRRAWLSEPPPSMPPAASARWREIAGMISVYEDEMRDYRRRMDSAGSVEERASWAGRYNSARKDYEDAKSELSGLNEANERATPKPSGGIGAPKNSGSSKSSGSSKGSSSAKPSKAASQATPPQPVSEPQPVPHRPTFSAADQAPARTSLSSQTAPTSRAGRPSQSTQSGGSPARRAAHRVEEKRSEQRRTLLSENETVQAFQEGQRMSGPEIAREQQNLKALRTQARDAAARQSPARLVHALWREVAISETRLTGAGLTPQ